MKGSQISYLWKSPRAAHEFAAGVSLHSHTNASKETLDFLVKLVSEDGWVGRLLRDFNAAFEVRHGVPFEYRRAYWTPPLPPRLAFDLERSQVEDILGRPALVSITDHDNMRAPLLLRTVASARHIPVSVEWTVPFAGDQAFHIGVHNLPSSTGSEWLHTFQEFTANPSDRRLTELLSALHDLPNVLVIFNHPMWDLYTIGESLHAQRVEEFMQQNGAFVHAIELNGLRDWNENRAVKQLAARWNKLLISGGDRHGLEPNANVNLTHATNFNDFVHEVRVEGRSHVLFMPQYMRPWKHRIMQSTVDAVRDHPDLPAGSRMWDERVFYPMAAGTSLLRAATHSLESEPMDRPLAELWPGGSASMALRAAIAAVRLMGRGPVSGGLRLAWNEPRQLQFALGEPDTY